MKTGPHGFGVECAKCKKSSLWVGTEHILDFELCPECRKVAKEIIKAWIEDDPVASAGYGRVGPGTPSDSGGGDPRRRGGKFDPNEPW